MPFAYSYVRFSSDKQELGDSLRRQLTLAEAYASKHKLSLDTHSYRDLGISAFKGKNAIEGALASFLRAVDERLIPSDSYLLIESMDRLSRQQVDVAMELFLSITRRGITIVTLQDGQEYSKTTIKDNWTKLIIALAVMARANEESATKSRRVSEALAAKVKSGKPLATSMPPWLTLNATQTAYVVNKKKADIVRRAFKLALEGNGIYLIMKKFNEEGVPVLRNAKDGWAVSHVGKLLHSQSVFGRLVSKHGIVDDHYPSIVDKDDFYKVQELIEQRKSSGRGRKGLGVANLFSGLCRCGECGSPVRFLRIPSGGHKNSYLECLNAYEGKGCEAKRINYDPLEKTLLDTLLFDVGIQVIEQQYVDPTIELRAELADKKAQIEKLVDLIEDLDPREAKNLLGRLRTRQAEHDELEKRLLEVRPSAPVATAEAIEAALELWRKHADASLDDGTDLRMKLQSAIKTFVEEIRLPQAIVLGYDNKTKFRQAVIKLRGATVNRLASISPDALTKVAPDFEFDSLDTPATERTGSTLTVPYPVPQVGGARVRGQTKTRSQ